MAAYCFFDPVMVSTGGQDRIHAKIMGRLYSMIHRGTEVSCKSEKVMLPGLGSSVTTANTCTKRID